MMEWNSEKLTGKNLVDSSAVKTGRKTETRKVVQLDQSLGNELEQYLAEWSG
jgi:hypothetical protein